MGKIVSNMFMALDGVVEAPEQWQRDYFNDEMGTAVGKATAEYEAVLMGRVLYDEWAAFWPGQPESPFKSFITNVPKYVVSSTLTEASWDNTTVISGEVEAQVKALKDRTAGSIGMSGSATVVRWLIENGLLDELNVMVHPVAVGHGRRLFEGAPTQPLRLVSHEVFATGVLNLRYVPAEGH